MKGIVAPNVNFELWQLISNTRHEMVKARQRELKDSQVTVSQAYILRFIYSLGSEATAAKIAKFANREVHTIARKAAIMEKDGLIKRISDTPKSTLLRFELTDKGMKVLEMSIRGESINSILSFIKDEERKQLTSIMNKIINNAKKYSPNNKES